MATTRPVAARDDLRSDIVAAASRLLREQGAQAVTTRAVAQAAGVQAPTIYRLFGDKDGLIDAVAEHVMAAYVAEKANAVVRDDSDPVVALRSAWQLHVQFGVTNAELYVLLNAPGRRASSPATSAGIDLLRTRVRRIAAAGLLRVDEQRAVQMIHAAGSGTVLALLTERQDQRDADLSGAMFDAVAAAILAEPPVGHDDNVSAVAISFSTVLPDLPGLTDAERTLMTEWVGRSLARLRQT